MHDYVTVRIPLNYFLLFFHVMSYDIHLAATLISNVEKETNRFVRNSTRHNDIRNICRAKLAALYLCGYHTHAQNTRSASVCSSGPSAIRITNIFANLLVCERVCVCYCVRLSSRLNASVRSLLRRYLMPHIVYKSLLYVFGIHTFILPLRST